MDNANTPKTPREAKEAVEKLFPGKKMLVVAMQDINVEEQSFDTAQSSHMFAFSSIRSKTDMIQLSVLLAKNPEMKELFAVALKTSDLIEKDKSVMDILEKSMKVVDEDK